MWYTYLGYHHQNFNSRPSHMRVLGAIFLLRRMFPTTMHLNLCVVSIEFSNIERQSWIFCEIYMEEIWFSLKRIVFSAHMQHETSFKCIYIHKWLVV